MVNEAKKKGAKKPQMNKRGRKVSLFMVADFTVSPNKK